MTNESSIELQKSSVEKLRSGGNLTVDLEQRICSVTEEVDELLTGLTDNRVAFFVLRTGQLAESIRLHRQKWTATYGELLRDRASTLIRHLRDSIRVSVKMAR